MNKGMPERLKPKIGHAGLRKLNTLLPLFISDNIIKTAAERLIKISENDDQNIVFVDRLKLAQLAVNVVGTGNDVVIIPKLVSCLLYRLPLVKLLMLLLYASFANKVQYKIPYLGMIQWKLRTGLKSTVQVVV